MLEIKLIKKTDHGYDAEYTRDEVNSMISIPNHYLIRFIQKSMQVSDTIAQMHLNVNSKIVVTEYIKSQLPERKKLNFLELSDMCDVCLSKERAAIDAENMHDAEFYSKCWAIIIAEMAKCEVAPTQLINV